MCVPASDNQSTLYYWKPCCSSRRHRQDSHHTLYSPRPCQSHALVLSIHSSCANFNVLFWSVTCGNLRSPMCAKQLYVQLRKSFLLWAKHVLSSPIWDSCWCLKICFYLPHRKKIGNSCVWFACQKALFVARRGKDQTIASQRDIQVSPGRKAFRCGEARVGPLLR